MEGGRGGGREAGMDGGMDGGRKSMVEHERESMRQRERA
jgi:hypothetical protein